MELPVADDFDIYKPDLGENVNQNRIPDVKTIYETALAIKPQIKNAVVSKEIASLDEDIARAGYYPVLSASAGISSSYSSQLTDPYFNQVNDGIRPGIGFSLAIPIYQKKQVRTSVAVSKINYLNAGLNETDTRNQLRKNIEQACQDVISAQIEYEASLQKYLATNESSLLSDEKFTQGLINSVDYLVQKTNLIIAESQLLQSKYNILLGYKILDFYMGVPFNVEDEERRLRLRAKSSGSGLSLRAQGSGLRVQGSGEGLRRRTSQRAKGEGRRAKGGEPGIIH
jgi:outer membrane protein